MFHYHQCFHIYSCAIICLFQYIIALLIIKHKIGVRVVVLTTRVNVCSNGTALFNADRLTVVYVCFCFEENTCNLMTCYDRSLTVLFKHSFVQSDMQFGMNVRCKCIAKLVYMAYYEV